MNAEPTQVGAKRKRCRLIGLVDRHQSTRADFCTGIVDLEYRDRTRWKTRRNK
jgi:hypothetical protein